MTHDNRKDQRRSSGIVAIDPSSRAVRDVPVDPDLRLRTRCTGRDGYLDGGTLQADVTLEGRALVLDADGALVLEIDNVFGDEHDAFPSDHALLAPDFFDTDPARFTRNSGDIPS